MTGDMRFEVCVDSVESAIAAQQGGAHRVELCDNLVEGGTTPSAGAIQLTRRHLDIAMHVMIRPRGGDFCNSDIEFEVMQRDIELAKEWGADGVVIGILNPDGSVDLERTGTLVELARPMSVTFHRAFDMTADPYQALDDLIRLGIDRVLTSGQENSMMEGLDLITDLVRRAGDRIIVMAGGGITERNAAKIVEQSGVKEIHFGAPMHLDSPMAYRNLHCFMGAEFRPPEYTLTRTDPDRVQTLIHTLKT